MKSRRKEKNSWKSLGLHVWGARGTLTCGLETRPEPLCFDIARGVVRTDRITGGKDGPTEESSREQLARTLRRKEVVLAFTQYRRTNKGFFKTFKRVGSKAAHLHRATEEVHLAKVPTTLARIDPKRS